MTKLALRKGKSSGPRADPTRRYQAGRAASVHRSINATEQVPGNRRLGI